MKHESTSSKEFDENKQHAINENKFEQLEADNKKTISDELILEITIQNGPFNPDKRDVKQKRDNKQNNAG